MPIRTCLFKWRTLAILKFHFDVKNIGECVSDEVVQIYASAKSRVPKPRRQLLAFERLYDILPQETRHVTKRVNARFLRNL